MHLKKSILIIGSIALFSVQLSVSALNVHRVPMTKHSTQSLTRIMPDHVYYELFFRHVTFLEELIITKEHSAQSSHALRSIADTELPLSQTERVFLVNLAKDSMQKAAAMDKNAEDIIKRYRSLYPGGKVGRGQPRPQLPTELISLQQARNQLFTNSQNALHNTYGDDKYAEIDALIKQYIARNMVR